MTFNTNNVLQAATPKEQINKAQHQYQNIKSHSVFLGRSMELDHPGQGSSGHKPRSAVEVKIGVKQVRISGMGRFVLYQVRTGKGKFSWFIVFAGTEAEASAFEAKFVITTIFTVVSR